MKGGAGAAAMKAKVPYGETQIEFEIGNCSLARVVLPPDTDGVSDAGKAIEDAMEHPIGAPRLRERTKPGQKAVIVVNDVTRPAPTGPMVRAIAGELQMGGVREADITLVVATGNHRGNTADELKAMLGEDVVRRFRIINHDCNNMSQMVYLGDTSMGVPVWVNRAVMDADIKVLTGLITPHHSAGFSGGRKSILPGVSGIETLRIHHSLPIRPFEPAMGWLEGNPFHEQAVEAARMAGVDFMVNTVHNRKKQVIRAVAGDVSEAHVSGARTCRDAWSVPVPEPADIVIASPGGYPRDINLHQAQKAVSCAELFVRRGGVVILVAECRDGTGDFAGWLKAAPNPQAVIERFKREGYTKESSAKAFMFARGLSRFDVIVVSRCLPPGELEEMFMAPAESVEHALKIARTRVGPNPRVVVLPYGSEVMPVGNGPDPGEPGSHHE